MKKKKAKLKLKKQAYYILAGFVAIIVMIILGINFYNDYKYKQTNEYKLTEKGYSLEESKLINSKWREKWTYYKSFKSKILSWEKPR